MPFLKLARRAAICIIGTIVLLLGVVMLVLPGPALLVIPAGLAILAMEFPWARKWLHVARAKAHETLSRSYRRGGNRKSSGRRRADQVIPPKQP
ncbi:MAG: PGPGW domain-containing protein [Gammaproteobacteria bacterium]